jgi:hypothetical protein
MAQILPSVTVAKRIFDLNVENEEIEWRVILRRMTRCAVIIGREYARSRG